MFKQLAALILLMAFGFQTFSRAIILVSYYTNTSSYAKNCINKAKPILHCNGKCQMMKKLKEEDKKDKQNPERKSEVKNEIPISSRSFFAVIEYIKFAVKLKREIAHYPNDICVNHPTSIFHPPQFC